MFSAVYSLKKNFLGILRNVFKKNSLNIEKKILDLLKNISYIEIFSLKFFEL